jgi:hypothetical protein
MEAKLIFRAILCLVFPLGLHAQSSFYKIFSGNGYDRAEGVCQLSDSGFLITGTSSSFEDAPAQAFLLRLDYSGEYLWSRAYGGTESEEGKRVMAVEGYGFYVAGTSSSGGSGDFDNYLFFTDPQGIPVWETINDNGGWERIHDAVMMPDTTIITVGETDAGSEGRSDIYLCRYSKTGDLMWEMQYGSDSSDIAYAAAIFDDTSFLVAGSYFVNDSLQNKAYVALYHKDGTLIWEKTYGEYGDYWLRDIVRVDETRIKAVGESIKTGYYDYDSYGIKLDSQGNPAGTIEYYVDQAARFVGLAPFEPGPDGRLFIAEQSVNSNTPTYPEGEDAAIQRMTGDFFWDGYGMFYAGVGQDQINHIIPTSDGFAVAVGYCTTYGPGGNGITIIKIGSETTFPYSSTNPDIEDIVLVHENPEIPGLIVYPNPASDVVNVEVSGGSFDAVLLDVTGKIAGSWAGISGALTIPMNALSQGAYLLRVRANDAESVIRVIRR